MVYALALSAAVVWGWTDFAGGRMSRALRPLVVICVSQLISALLFLPVVLLAATAGEAWSSAGWAALAGVLIPVGLGLLYGSLALGPMSIVAPIAATSVVVPVAVGLLRGERLGPAQYVGAAVVMAGIVLATGPDLRNGRMSLRAVSMAAGAALSMGLVLVFAALGATTGVTTTVFTMRLVGGVVAALVLVVTGRLSGSGVGGNLPALVGIGMGDLAGHLAFAYAAGGGLLSVTSVLSSLYPVFTVLLAWRLQAERLRSVQAAGVVAAFTGVALLVA